MTKPSERPAVKAFLQALQHESISTNLAVTLTITGGAPGKSIESSYKIWLDGRVNAALRDDLQPDLFREKIDVVVDNPILTTLIRALTSGIDTFKTRDTARFAPDTPVGMLTIEAAGEREDLFFVADERMDDSRSFDPELREAFNALRNSVHDLTKKENEGGNCD